MADDLYQRLVDRQVLHALRIFRLGNGETKRILALLLQTERAVLEKLVVRLASIERRGVDLGPVTTRRLRNLLREIAELQGEFWDAASKQLKATGAQLATTEALFQQRLLQEVFASAAVAELPDLRGVRAIINNVDVLGTPFADIIQNGRDNSLRRVEQAIRIGLISSETTPQIVARVRNVQRNANRRGVESMVRTVITHVSAQAREQTFVENDDIVEGVMWVATLDTRTCPTCADLDGRRFPVGEGPRPAIHLNCRCATVPLLDINEEIFGERASQFGPVPASDRYATWLRRQPASIQDEALGRTRGKLFRKGGLELGDFVDRTGRTFNLDELAERELDAFTMSGVKPPG